MARATTLVNGGLLVSERRRRLLEMTDAAAAIGISRGALSRAELGGPIRFDTARMIADFYGLKPSRVVHSDEAA